MQRAANEVGGGAHIRSAKWLRHAARAMLARRRRALQALWAPGRQRSSALCSACELCPLPPLRRRADGKGTGWWLPNRGTFKFAGSGDAFDYEDGSYNMTTFGNWSNWCQSSFSCACYAPDHCTMFRESSVFTTK